MQSLSFVAKCLCHSSGLIRFIISHGVIFAAGMLVIGIIVTFCSARYNFKTCDFSSGVEQSNTAVLPQGYECVV